MKIAIQVHALNWGGAERVASCWANGLASLGHDVSVITDLNVGQAYELDPCVKIVQRKVYKKKSNSFFEKLKFVVLNQIYALKQSYNIFKKDTPDVFINVLYLHQILLLFARFFAGVKTKIIQTDHNAYERPKGSEMKLSQKRNKFFDNRFFDLVTVLTKRDKDILAAKGFKNVEVLYNPLFLKTVNQVPKKGKVILVAGRMAVWHTKGFDILIKAWDKIAHKFPDWKLKIIGAADEKAKEMLSKLGSSSLSQIEFADFSKDMQSEYATASIFVLSSRYEGWGLVLVEAMSQGCACIACDYKGRQAEIVENEVNGLICEPENVDELASKMQKLISDGALREKLQKNAPLSVEKFEEIKVAKNLEDLIIKVVNEN